MLQLLALEWNSSEARLVLASGRGEQVVIEQAFSVPLAPRQPGAENEEVDIGGRIAAALAAKGIGRIDALVGLGRSNIKLRQLHLPPAPDDELPEMVRLQAMQEFSDLDEQSLLDFVPIDHTPDGPWTVLVAAVGSELVGQIQGVCQSAGLKMRRLVPRAYAAVSLVSRAGSGQSDQLRLLVDLLDDEAELTAMFNGKVVFLRSARLSGAPPLSPTFLSEIRRTMAAVENQLGGRKIEAIVLCGRDETHAALARQIQQELETPVELFDPFSGLSLDRDLAAKLPDHPGRFAPLLGMLLAEFEQWGHAMDFLHPRRPAAPPNLRRKYIIAGATAALLAAAWLVYTRVESGRLAGEVQELQMQSQALDQAVLQADKVRATAAEIGKWTDTDVVWLEQLRSLSREFPAADSVILHQLTFGPAPGGGEMRLRGFAEKSGTIAALEDALRRRSRHVVDHESHEDHSQHGYSWRFDASVFVGRESP